MKDTSNITIRIDRELLHRMRVRAATNDRSINKEFSAMAREYLKNDETTGSGLATSPAVSQPR